MSDWAPGHQRHPSKRRCTRRRTAQVPASRLRPPAPRREDLGDVEKMMVGLGGLGCWRIITMATSFWEKSEFVYCEMKRSSKYLIFSSICGVVSTLFSVPKFDPEPYLIFVLGVAWLRGTYYLGWCWPIQMRSFDADWPRSLGSCELFHQVPSPWVLGHVCC